MKVCGVVVLWVGVLMSLFLCGLAAEGSERVREGGGAVMELGALRVTSSVLELRCAICNEGEEDLWIYAGRPRPGSARAVAGTNAELFAGRDGETLVVLRRMNRPYRCPIPEFFRRVPYARLHPGERRAEVVSIGLPLSLARVMTETERGIAQALEEGVESFKRLAFEIGYFTEQQLRSIRAHPGPLRLGSTESADEVVIEGLIPSGYQSEERSIRITLDGVRLPYRKWIKHRGNRYASERGAEIVRGMRRVWNHHGYHAGGGRFGEDRYAESLFAIDEELFNDAARQLAAVYAEFADGRIDPAALPWYLDKVLSREERRQLLDELGEKHRRLGPSRLPPGQAVEEAFYNSALDCDQYRYVQRLFGIDAGLLDDAARRITGVYLEAAHGKLDSDDLTDALDEILGAAERERLLEGLEAKQARADQQKEKRVTELLVAAKRHESPAEGRKALALLGEALTIDPSSDEAFELMRTVGAFYEGQVLTNSIGMRLSWVPAGEFVMGKKGRSFHVLVHPVRLSSGFWMGVHEVMQAQYEAVMGTSPGGNEGSARPATDLSWHDAVAFCQRLGEREGRTYRLPTEAEWEYACRAGTSTDYWWGDDRAAAPGTPNAFGLLDMHGGVGEWCHDWYSNGYYLESPGLDPPGPGEPVLERVRVVRGGDYMGQTEGRYASWRRGRYYSGKTSRFIGFRVVLED